MPEPPITPSTDWDIKPRFPTPYEKSPKLFKLWGPSSSDEFASVRAGPDALLGEVQEPGEHDEEDHDLEADALAGLHVRLGRPHQERRDVLGVLVDCGRRTVGVVDALVRERRRHRSGMPGEVFVVEARGR